VYDEEMYRCKDVGVRGSTSPRKMKIVTPKIHGDLKKGNHPVVKSNVT